MPLKNELAKTSLRGSLSDTAGIGSYTEVAIDTNLAITGQFIYTVTGAYFRHDANVNGNARQVDVVLAYASQSALITPGDSDYLFGAAWYGGQVTSGSSVYSNLVYQQIDHFPIATQQIFLCLKTENIATATNVDVKLMGYHTKVSSQDFFRLAQSR